MIMGAAKLHFDQDILRAREIMDHADALPDGLLKSDLLRSAWMMGVGACDAFFCDAYADVVSRTLRAKELQATMTIPDRLGDLKVPVVALLDGAGGWRWRMAARALIENENVLSLEKIKKLLNLFCREQHKLMTEGAIEAWLLHPHAKQRMFGVARNNYMNANAAQKNALKTAAMKRLNARMEEIFQRRHDCIHNCDRPRMALQYISTVRVEKALQDIQFVVERSCESLRTEFPEFLRSRGCSGVTRNTVGA